MSRATVIILCKSIYDFKLYQQILKQAYQLKQQKKVIFYVLKSNTFIKEHVNKMQVLKTDFATNTFIIVDAARANDVKDVINTANSVQNNDAKMIEV